MRYLFHCLGFECESKRGESGSSGPTCESKASRFFRAEALANVSTDRHNCSEGRGQKNLADRMHDPLDRCVGELPVGPK